jgi:NAD(P)H-flavin reductase
MANVPTESRTLEFFVRLRSGGRFSDAILAMRSAGERVELDGPFGTFTLGHDASDVVFVAGGTGLGPILAMLRQAASERSPRAMLLCLGVEEEVELFALPEVARLASQCPSLQVRVTVTRPTDGWAGERGRVLELLTRVLAELSDAARERAYYLCGPPVMVEGAREVLQACGVPHANVHAEPFAATGS